MNPRRVSTGATGLRQSAVTKSATHFRAVGVYAGVPPGERRVCCRSRGKPTCSVVTDRASWEQRTSAVVRGRSCAGAAHRSVLLAVPCLIYRGTYTRLTPEPQGHDTNNTSICRTQCACHAKQCCKFNQLTRLLAAASPLCQASQA